MKKGLLVLLGAIAIASALLASNRAGAASVPAGFQDSVVFSGLSEPTALRFASDGRIFVAEKSGLIKVYDNVNDPTPTIFADLSTNVYNFWDRGLLGLALDPQFPSRPYVYVLYTFDAAIGGTAPRWGTPGILSDPCPTPPGPTGDGCVVSGRISRLTADGDVWTGSEQVLVNDWCQQFPSHSVGTLTFGADGALYAGAGDGGSFNFADWGQTGTPKNPCGDPPTGVGGNQTPPTAEGGALRAQDLRTSGDPVTLDGSIIRIDPNTGLGMPDNPLALDPDLNARRIIAEGFRNPFRFAVKPGTSEIWAGDVGWNEWEELDRLGSVTDSAVDNFGWPCFEGAGHQSGYDGAGLNICQSLYNAGSGSVTGPYYTYSHGEQVVNGEACPTGSSSISGIAFNPGGSYPASYDGALFFADYSRDCMWVMFRGANGQPDPATRATFMVGPPGPVDLQFGPTGDLFYADLNGGTIHRIRYLGSNGPPTAIARANPDHGLSPLTVNFDGSSSSDPEGGNLSYSWDLNGDGVFGDSTAVSPSRTYAVDGTYNVRLRVTDPPGASDTTSIVVNVGNNTPPVPTITTPTSNTTWRVGDVINFSGSATDTQDGTEPAARLSWSLDMHHCPSNCHVHHIQDFVGTASGSLTAPDHEYPSHMELTLTATDSAGLSASTSVDLNPQTVLLNFASSPPGLHIVVNATDAIAPFTRQVIIGSTNSVSAPSPQVSGSGTYDFTSWSDGGARSHIFVAPATATTYTATFTARPGAPAVAAWAFDENQGTTTSDASGNGNNGTVSGATWTAAGKFGSALSFDGNSDWVTVPDSGSLDLTLAMTLEAWVRPSVNDGWHTLLFKEQPGDLVYGLYPEGWSGRPDGQMFVTGSAAEVRGPSVLPVNVWSHVALTYDGSALTLFVNGTQVASVGQTGNIAVSNGVLHIGGNAVWGEWFQGLIDEVRVYNRALTGAEITTDMGRPITNPDSQPPSAPGTLTATGGLGQVALSWGAATDNVGVHHYNVHRGTTAGFTPSAANRIAQPTGLSYTDAGQPAGTYYYRVTAEDAAGNVGPVSNEASATVTADTQPPSAPGTLTATGGPGQVALAWGAAADNVGVHHYNLHRGTTAGFTPSAANRIAQPTGLSYTDTGLATGTYYYRVSAEDAAGNVGPFSNEASAVVTNPPPPTGLVGAWAFDENQGTSAADASGNTNTGTLTGGVAWNAAGKFGAALSFDGVNDFVNIPDANTLDLTTGMTLEAWVRPTSLGGWRTVLMKEQPGNLVYDLYGSRSGTNVPVGEIIAGGGSRNVNGSAAIAVNTWTHLALTYNGTALTMYVNGVQSGQTVFAGSIATSTGALKVGGNAIWGEWFQGLIDEVRVYNRALTGAEITTDMGRPITNPDSQPPSAPGTLTATGGLGQVALSWGAATDNVGVHHYNVHRGTTAGFTPSAANRIAQPTGLSYTDAGQPAGTYYYRVTAEDAAGNVGPVSNEASATVTADTQPPSAPGTLTATGGPGQVALAWGAAADNVGVHHYNLHRGTTAGFTPSAANRIAQPTGLSYTDTGLATGTYYYRVSAEDAAGNVGPFSNEASAVVTNPPPPTGLVGAWAFDENQGTSAADASGNTNTGTLTGGVAWNAAGKFGAALSFDGVNDFVNIPDANTLDLTTGMTLEAWVRPTSLGGWRTVLMKEQPGNLVYDLYGSRSGTNVPVGEIIAGGGSRNVNGSAAIAVNTWTHLALTYNGTALTMYVNGVQSGQTVFAGSIATSTGALKVGGNAIWGEWFQGLIDEVRVYNRALTGAEITTDMGRPITNPDSQPPSAPGTLTATGGLGQVALSWGAATDNVGVHHYNVHRGTTAGFTPSAANRIAQPTGLSYTDAGQPAGTYYYRVTAEDAAGNVGPVSNEASATVTADTQPPSAPGTLTATGGPGQVALAWGAAADNVGVHHYNLHRGTTAGFTPSAANRIAQPTGLSYTDTGLATGTYYYRVSAEDAAGNVGPFSNEASAVVTNPPPPTGLVGAWAFDENQGTSAADASGNTNTGTLTGGVAWNAAGKFGAALSFDGVNDFVNIPDANTLDLTTGMTLEAWVRPTSLGGWRTVLMKEQTNDIVYDLYANRSSGVPTTELFTGGSVSSADGTTGLPLDTWTYLTATYDGSAQRLYVNGTLAATRAVAGNIFVSTGALKVGGNGLWGEWFQGLIDEVRVYNRALSASEVQTDMNRRVGG